MLGRALKPSWPALHPLHSALSQKCGVPAEDLVTAVSAQHHAHGLPSRLRQLDQRQKRAIDQRLIEQVARTVQESEGVLRGKLDFRVVGAAVPGHGTREPALIVARLGKPETEGLDGAAADLGGDRRNRAGIDATTQEHAQRHVTRQLMAGWELVDPREDRMWCWHVLEAEVAV